ncbi:MAG: alpha/beta hydrolase [Pseudomonadota bacterium]
MIRAALIWLLAATPAIAEDFPALFRGGSENVTLSGSVKHAAQPGAPAVVLVSGSGLQDRDFSHRGQQIFRRLAERLADLGVTTLRYDDRGFGASSGNPDVALADEAADALAALDQLCRQAAIDPSRIGIVGHSSGGIAAARALTARGGAGMAIMLASPVSNGAEVLLYQTRASLTAAGMPEEVIAQNTTQVRRLINAALNGDQDLAETARQIAADAGADRQWTDLQISIFGSAWMREFLTHDPAADLIRLGGPVLMLYGDRDVQVDAKTNTALARRALDGNRFADVRVVPGTGHLMQQTARLNHLTQTGPAPSDAVIRIVAEWIKAQPPLTASPCRGTG